jgi:hypothetical protein
MKKLIFPLLLLTLFINPAQAAETKAKRVRIIDAGSYYTGTEVETALQEITDGTVKFPNLIPQTDNTFDIGENSTPLEWRNIYIDTTAYIDSFGQDALASIDNTYDLGTAATEWKDLHLDGSAYIDDFAQNILPSSHNSLDIGSTSHKFKDLYIEGTAYLGAISGGAGFSETDTLDTVCDRGATTDQNMSTTGTFSSEDLSSTDDASVTDNLTVGTLTNAPMSINSGSITGGVNGTFTGTVTAEQITSTDDLSVADAITINGTMVISSGSIVDTTGAISLGTSNVTIGGDLTVAGNITLTGVSSGSIRPTTDLVYELGAEDKRYVRVNAREYLFDPDTYFYFDGTYVYLYVNGELQGRWGAAAVTENVLYDAGSGNEQVTYGGENVIF